MCATFCSWICEEYIYCKSLYVKSVLVQVDLLYFKKKKKHLCSSILHICNIYVNRKENFGIMKPIESHALSSYCCYGISSSPWHSMFKSLMWKKKSFLSPNCQITENCKSLPCTKEFNIMEKFTNENVFMRLWTDMAFLVLVLVLHKQMRMWCVKDLYSSWSKIGVG